MLNSPQLAKQLAGSAPAQQLISLLRLSSFVNGGGELPAVMVDQLEALLGDETLQPQHRVILYNIARTAFNHRPGFFTAVAKDLADPTVNDPVTITVIPDTLAFSSRSSRCLHEYSSATTRTGRDWGGLRGARGAPGGAAARLLRAARPRRGELHLGAGLGVRGAPA